MGLLCCCNDGVTDVDAVPVPRREVTEVHVEDRVNGLKLRAVERFGIKPEKCHVGHVVLQAMAENPEGVNQIDAGTDERETHGSVLIRSCRLASAMRNFGLKVGDVVAVMGPNHLDLAIPYYASHYNGHTLCAMDPNISIDDLKHVFSLASPKIVFCLQSQEENIKLALTHNGLDPKLVLFDGGHMQSFISNNKGTEVGFKPSEFDQEKTTAWLMLTSGTTGRPKCAIIPYVCVLNAILCWWVQFTERIHVTLTFGTIQWMSSMIFYISGPVMYFSRVQTTMPPSPQWLITAINKYKPNATAWTPHLLDRFLSGASHLCDLSSFKYIAIGGSSIEKPLVNKLSAVCNAYLYLVYGMTELMVPVFDFNKETPFGSSGRPFKKFQYRLVADDGADAQGTDTGELWIKGDQFFKGYLKNPEETKSFITEDGWIKTGDIFYKDEKDYYFYVERKRLLIKYQGMWVAPLHLEEIIHTHPAVESVCVVGIPDTLDVELPVAAIVRKNGANLDPQEIFDLLKREMPPQKQLHGGLFFMDALPTTPSDKVHRAKIREIAFSSKRILSNQ